MWSLQDSVRIIDHDITDFFAYNCNTLLNRDWLWDLFRMLTYFQSIESYTQESETRPLS